MALTSITGEIQSQPLNDNFSYHNQYISTFLPTDTNNLSATMSYNSTPNNGTKLKIMDGDNTTATTAGTTASVYIQRVDESITADDPGHLIPALYTVFKRKSAGTGWLYSGLFYLEDQSNSGNAQSVACAGMAYATNNAAVWGMYGDAISYNVSATITGAEFNAHNSSGSNYSYVISSPTTYPFSCGTWIASGGSANNSFGLGIGSVGALWGCGIYFQSNTITNYGIDMQATPPTCILLHGASNDGLGSIPGGIGIDAGTGSFYGQATNQGFIHIRNEDICFGEDGLGKIRFNATNGYLEFWYNGIRRGYLDCAGADHAI